MATDANKDNFQIILRTAGGAHEVVKVSGTMNPDIQAALAQAVLAHTPDGTQMPTVPADQLPGVQRLNVEQVTVPMRMPVRADLPRQILVEAADTLPMADRTQPLPTPESEARERDGEMLRALRRNADLQAYAQAQLDEDRRYATELDSYRNYGLGHQAFIDKLMSQNPSGPMPLEPLAPTAAYYEQGANPAQPTAATHTMPASQQPHPYTVSPALMGTPVLPPKHMSDEEIARIDRQIDGWEA